MLTYPPEGHRTDSKRIFFIGSAQGSCNINGASVPLTETKNFAYMVDLKLGENLIKVDIDGETIERTIVGIKSEVEAPVAYAKYYDSFPASQTIKENILKGITVYKDKIEIPLSLAPIYNLEKRNAFHFSLDLSEIKSDLDWIHYVDKKPCIKVYETSTSKLDIHLNKAVKCCEEKWENNNLAIMFRYQKTEPVVCIDPGHGGSHTGSISPKGIFEKHLNLSFVLKLAEELNDLGIENYITRKEDYDISLSQRVNFAKDNNSTFFISLHHNALPDARDPILERGFSCHYFYEHSFDFAEYLAFKLDEFSGIPFSGIYRQNLHVLRENPGMIALLLEMGFLIHPEESDLITSTEFQDKNSKVIAKAIYNFSKELS